jgi:hypothetical protein
MKAFIIALALTVPLGAAEPAAPVVRASDAPEVTDPDLKEATPAMREGAEEPVGGWESRQKGRSALTLGWDQHAVLGWTYWLGERLAVRAALGGAYSEAQGAPYRSDLSERLALRCLLMPLGGAGHLFAQASAGARQRHSYQEVQTDAGAYVQFDTSNSYTHDYSLGLDLGAELFWPGSRRASLELAAGLGALWSFGESRTDTASQPGTALPSSSAGSSTRSFGLDSRFGSLAANLYF